MVSVIPTEALGAQTHDVYTLVMNRTLFSFIIGASALITPVAALAAPNTLTYTYEHHIISVQVSARPEWKQPKRTWLYRGVPAIPPARLQSCGDEPLTEDGWSSRIDTGWNDAAIQQTLRSTIVDVLDRDAGSVVIRQSSTGAISFEGEGLTGRAVAVQKLVALTKAALDQNISTIVIPVDETQPTIVVDDALRALGIKEVVTIGESVFVGSPLSRRHNIRVGVEKFNGHLIPQGSVFSFVETLGPVNQYTGYKKELVIQGDATLPDYGGGLCQVSTTAYRGPWEYGLPILQRKNHSYAVSYYSPQGTDATIYPPNVDIKFRNDTPGALLIQSFLDDQSRAFFIYYGTRDDRQTDVFGPFISDRKSAPKEERISYTTDIPPGEKRKAGERHDGMNVVWYRNITRTGSGTMTERVFSSYQTRPLYWQIGVTQEEMARRTGTALSETPSWLPSSEDRNTPSSDAR